MTISFEPGSVVVVLYPFSDLAITRPRPAVILSSAEFARDVGQTTVAMITTAARSTWPGDTPIHDLDSAGLKRSSVVRMRFVTVVNQTVAAEVGRLGRADRAAVTAALSRVIGL